jgi:FlaA1/EpsC-like NDP-sugar epimerase
MATQFMDLKKPSYLWSSRYLTRHTQFALDTATLACALVLSYVLRFDFDIPPKEINHLLVQLPLVVVIQLTALWLAGVQTFIWRYVGLSEIKAFVRAGLYSVLPLVALRIFLPDQYQGFRVPLSVIVVDAVLGFGSTLGLRVARRVFFERYEKRGNVVDLLSTHKRKPVLLIGAGRAGVLAAREIQNSGNVDVSIRGFIDDDLAKRGAVISGVKVLGTTDDLPRLVAELKIDHVVISIAHASRRDFKRILDICQTIPVKARTIPGLYEILMGNVKMSRIRDLRIEDVLGRTQVEMDEQPLVEFLAGKTVMVTGAGGSIGSELARQIARFEPTSLLLVERAEFALFNIDLELRELWPTLEIVPLVADICDEARMRSILSELRPQVILHAAAHKHVPMMEFNPCEAAKNNILGTQLIGELAGEYGVDVFVLISSDKAVKPRSVMGATKRTAELIVQDLNCRCSTRYIAVRFGNVIDSAGSVIPIFRNQILKGGPITVTHHDMKRYFMTIPEATQLVLQAGAMGEGGEIFILDMGDPVKILDLAKEIITLSGLKPYEDIDIVFTGLRPGEKLFEELDTAEERVEKTKHQKILIGKIAPYPTQRIEHALAKIALLARNGRDGELCRLLNELLPEADLEIVGKQCEVAPDLQQRIA